VKYFVQFTSGRDRVKRTVRGIGWTDQGAGSKVPLHTVFSTHELLLKAARRREIDVILVWRLDRWGRSVTDLVLTLKDLSELGVAFVSLTEALDLTTPSGRAMAGLLAVFAEFEREILRERVVAGLAQARKQGKTSGAASFGSAQGGRNSPISG
jgi:DNA invertase Pin-like site-specific DNA recombinase